MARFVLLRHEFSPSHPKGSHWDFMLEAGEHLATWTLAELPAAWISSLDTSVAETSDAGVRAVRIHDHRLAYLDYEGPVSNDRGVVSRCDRGDFDVEAWSDDMCRVALRGNKLRGVAELHRVRGEAWELRCLWS